MRDHPSDAPIRIGVIGLGAAGSAMIAAIRAHPRMILAGGADLNPILRDRFATDNGCDAHGSAVALVDREDVEAVYIATPHQFHREHAMLASTRGKHVIVEKPIALSLDEADAMIGAARSAGCVLIVGHTHSFDPTVRKMREIIGSGQVGRLSMLTMLNYTDFLYRPRRPEELDTALGGGIMYNQIPHQVDMARLLADAPVRSVRATADVLDADRPTEGCCAAFISFENNVAANLTYSGYDRFDSDELCFWVGEGGQAKTPQHGSARQTLRDSRTSGDEAAVRAALYGYGGPHSPGRNVLAKPYQPHFGLLLATCERADLRQSPNGVTVYSADGVEELAVSFENDHPGWSDVLDELYAAVRQGTPPLHDGPFGRETLRTCLALIVSSRRNEEIRLADLEPLPHNA